MDFYYLNGELIRPNVYLDLSAPDRSFSENLIEFWLIWIIIMVHFITTVVLLW